MSHDSLTVPHGKTYILAGYTVPCDGTVVAWEFCYQINNATVTFYPGIWRMTRVTGGNTDYELVQSNTVTYNQSISPDQNPCRMFNHTTTDQFTAPAGSVVGLYSGTGPMLLHTNTHSSVMTYQFSGNQSSVNNAGSNDDVDYNIDIRVYVGKLDLTTVEV